ncbi:ADP-ribose pyrophosphatase [Rheinheimera sp. A13L]|uniref:NUDIX hydrolase n=1 Tax=Rheinheimera sp. A13L TaxID=506534 RepID=UPI0002125257|nr:NUDIX domain-containing protein [Rheinheimera sp. A13L]EGM76746.1 ADP-ribose pyrophosphatase [Rheinheimera sp. A13L]
MRLLHSLKHITPTPEHRLGERVATRAIVLRGSDILVLYTKRYDDYSLPGGGVEAGEDLESALVRELIEETGAKNVKIVTPFGLFEEFRPWYKDNLDVLRMLSYCYVCEISSELGQPNFEHYEIQNGMQVCWLNIYKAIRHNERILQTKPEYMGLSIVRETYLLRMIADQFQILDLDRECR